jgi:hypothetical protein
MPIPEEEAAIQSDAYIDTLLAWPRPRPPAVVLPRLVAGGPRSAGMAADDTGRAAELLSMLPRFHPPFAFEEALAARLRELAGTAGERAGLAEVIPFPGAVRIAGPLQSIDRRLIVGGAAIASGVSVAAVIAWWQAGRASAARRPRPEVVA